MDGTVQEVIIPKMITEKKNEEMDSSQLVKNEKMISQQLILMVETHNEK